MNPLYWSPRKLNTWRNHLRPGDPVSFWNFDASEKITGDISEVAPAFFLISSFDSQGKRFIYLRLRNELYPISQAPQRCDLGLTRPTAKRHVDHSGQRSRDWFKYLPGLPWLFCSLRQLCNRSTMDTGGSPERG